MIWWRDCPSCGRRFYDVQLFTAQEKAKACAATHSSVQEPEGVDGSMKP